MHEVYFEALEIHPFPGTFTPKKDRDVSDPANYDKRTFKELTAKFGVLASLLDKILRYNHDQVGFIKNRCSADNMRRLIRRFSLVALKVA